MQADVARPLGSVRSGPPRWSKGLDTVVAGYRSGVTITETRDVVIDAAPDVLVDLESLTEWSPAHQEVEVLERDNRGRPSRVTAGCEGRRRR